MIVSEPELSDEVRIKLRTDRKASQKDTHDDEERCCCDEAEKSCSENDGCCEVSPNFEQGVNPAAQRASRVQQRMQKMEGRQGAWLQHPQ